jgi:hypothetical protein
MDKAKLLIGLLAITGISMVLASGTQLARADIHKGVGSMMGLADDCSACRPGGSPCPGVRPATCSWQENCGPCQRECPDTPGVVCAYTGSPGSCSDTLASCGTDKVPTCVNNCYPEANCCNCWVIPWHTEVCDARNACL